MTLPAHRIETILREDGRLTLDNLPFRSGQAVEVILLPHNGGTSAGNPYPLRGTPYHYERPTDPVAEKDWDALQ